MKTTRSDKLFKEACELIPGGVNSPVRACLGVGADPLFIASAKGSHVTTVDGQEMTAGGNLYLTFGPDCVHIVETLEKLGITNDEWKLMTNQEMMQ